MYKRLKVIINMLIFIACFSVFFFLFSSLVDYLDRYSPLDFSHSMFLLGAIVGIFYNFLEIVAFLTTKFTFSEKVSYILRNLPSYFLLNGFLWYLYTFLNKLLSYSKDDNTYFQTLMIAFSIFFLFVKIGKEIKKHM